MNDSISVDVMGTATQLRGYAKLNSLNDVVGEGEGDEMLELHDIISQDQEDPSVLAARKLDWDAFVSSLLALERLIVEWLGLGASVKEIAVFAKVSVFTIYAYRNKIAQKIVEFFGPDILDQIVKTPAWTINLQCEREMVHCRLARRS